MPKSVWRRGLIEIEHAFDDAAGRITPSIHHPWELIGGGLVGGPGCHIDTGQGGDDGVEINSCGVTTGQHADFAAVQITSPIGTFMLPQDEAPGLNIRPPSFGQVTITMREALV